MQRLWIALLATCLVAPFAARADDVASVEEELPWWAHRESAQEGEVTPDEPADTTWWAGGPDAVLVLRGGEPLDEEGTAQAAGPEQPETGPPVDDGEDDGRNPLHHPRDNPRAGEEPQGTAGDPLVQEERRRDPNQCNRYALQIPRYEAQLEIAEQQGNDMAGRALQAQIDRLEARHEKYCAEPEGPSMLAKTVRVLAKMSRLALKAARIAAMM
jgi:hypothetical protein